ncbi:uncharacterized protein L201_005631 [Kwoniella dendrophila CBS 6074]|uniref:Uncharacterized protein n=1 Tax=Kwoniella dendrophila CBS 6074 TaxID=1295534 RepID=A0AAX4K0K8_9TREE
MNSAVATSHKESYYPATCFQFITVKKTSNNKGPASWETRVWLGRGFALTPEIKTAFNEYIQKVDKVTKDALEVGGFTDTQTAVNGIRNRLEHIDSDSFKRFPVNADTTSKLWDDISRASGRSAKGETIYGMLVLGVRDHGNPLSKSTRGWRSKLKFPSSKDTSSRPSLARYESLRGVRVYNSPRDPKLYIEAEQHIPRCGSDFLGQWSKTKDLSDKHLSKFMTNYPGIILAKAHEDALNLPFLEDIKHDYKSDPVEPEDPLIPVESMFVESQTDASSANPFKWTDGMESLI